MTQHIEVVSYPGGARLWREQAEQEPRHIQAKVPGFKENWEYFWQMTEAERSELLEPFQYVAAFLRLEGVAWTPADVVQARYVHGLLGDEVNRASFSNMARLTLAAALLNDVSPNKPEPMQLIESDWEKVAELVERAKVGKNYWNFKTNYPRLFEDINSLVRISHEDMDTSQSMGLIDLIESHLGWGGKATTHLTTLAQELGYEDLSVVSQHVFGGLRFLNKILGYLNDPRITPFEAADNRHNLIEEMSCWNQFVAGIHKRHLLTTIEARPATEWTMEERFTHFCLRAKEAGGDWPTIMTKLRELFGVDIAEPTLRGWYKAIKGNPWLANKEALLTARKQAEAAALLKNHREGTLLENKELALAEVVFELFSQNYSIDEVVEYLRTEQQLFLEPNDISFVIYNTVIALWESPHGREAIENSIRTMSFGRPVQHLLESTYEAAFAYLMDSEQSNPLVRRKFYRTLSPAVSKLALESKQALTERQIRVLNHFVAGETTESKMAVENEKLNTYFASVLIRVWHPDAYDTSWVNPQKAELFHLLDYLDKPGRFGFLSPAFNRESEEGVTYVEAVRALVEKMIAIDDPALYYPPELNQYDQLSGAIRSAFQAMEVTAILEDQFSQY